MQKLMIHKAICGFGSRRGPRETKRHRNASKDFKRRKSTTRKKYRTQQPHRDIFTFFFANLFFSMAQAPERRVFVDCIPFLMNEQWMRMHLVSLDIRSPTKVFFNRRGQHRSPDQWTQCFCGTSPKKKLRWSLKPWMAQSFLVGGEGFQPNLQGLTLPGSHWI